MSPPDLAGRRVVVAGLARSGVAACEALVARGALVTALDSATDGPVLLRAEQVERLGVRVVLGPDAQTLPADADLVIASPGWPPHAPLLVETDRRGVTMWGEVELAWRLRGPDAAPWLVVTGTNGKTTTTRMLESILQADGRAAIAVGNIGVPLVSVVTGPTPYDCLAVELGSPQLHGVRTVRAHAATVLNLAPDHIDWHGSFEAYRAAKRVAYDRCEAVAVVNADDLQSVALAEEARLGSTCRTVAFTLGAPSPGQLGVVDGSLVDRSDAGRSDAGRTDAGRTGAGRTDAGRTDAGRTGGADGVVLASVSDVHPAAPHNTANALAAAALARSVEVAPESVARGLARFVAEPHRITLVAAVDGVRWVDDSKATNTHAAATSLQAYPSVVWVAGGLAKGGQFDDLVRAEAGRLRGAVLLGTDRDRIAQALARHAPTIPVVEVSGEQTDHMPLMDRVVAAAAALARPGDTVLLAPACASWDQFSDYTERGRAFADAVARLVVAEAGEPA